MIKHDRYLITTADELTWKFDRPIIFLGEWCRLYDRRHIWENLDAIVSKPYGLGKLKKDIDFFQVKKLEQKLFQEFCEILNKHFDSNYSKKFWQILCGHWFVDILKLFLNRLNTLKQCFQSHKISGTVVYKNDNYNLAAFDLISSYFSFEDDRWNNTLNARLIEVMNIDFPKEFLEYQKKSDVKIKSTLNDKSFKAKIFKWSVYQYNKISRKFLKDKDAFIINSYLPTLLEIQLELALGQCPQLWGFHQRNFDLAKVENLHEKLLRQKLTKEFSHNKSKCDFENIVRSL